MQTILTYSNDLSEREGWSDLCGYRAFLNVPGTPEEAIRAVCAKLGWTYLGASTDSCFLGVHFALTKDQLEGYEPEYLDEVLCGEWDESVQLWATDLSKLCEEY